MGPLQLAQATSIIESTLDAITGGHRSPHQIERYMRLVSPRNEPALPAIWRLHASFMLATLLIEENMILQQYRAQWYLWVAKDCLLECIRKVKRDERFGDHKMRHTLLLAAEAIALLQQKLSSMQIAKDRSHRRM